MTWAQRLKRVFNIDVSICLECGGEAKVTVPVHPAPAALMHIIACIEDQEVIDRILNYLQAMGVLPPPPDLLPAARARLKQTGLHSCVCIACHQQYGTSRQQG